MNQQHIFIKYPPQCAICHKTPFAKVGIWHDPNREIYICNECHDKEVNNAQTNAADTLEE